MTFLIDGYNLLHAVGWATPRMPTGHLAAGRRRLLDWLADVPGHRSGAARLRVVFDAQNGPPGSGVGSHRGVLVQFAHHRTADDLIEELLDADPAPRAVTVVSNDARLHESARRAGSRGWGCQEFLDWVIESERTVPGAPHYVPPEKPDAPADAGEVADLLRAFSRPKPRSGRT